MSKTTYLSKEYWVSFSVLLLVVATMLSRCNKTGGAASGSMNNIGSPINTPMPTDAMSYYNFYTQPTYGTFQIYSFAAQASQNDVVTQVKGGFTDYNNKGTIGVPGGTVQIGTANLTTPDPSNGYAYGVFDAYFDAAGANFWGKKINFVLHPNPNNAAVVADTSLYIPQLIKIVKPAYTGSKPALSVGTQFTWNVDPNNTRGVMVIVQYDATDYRNSSLKAAGYTNSKSITIPVYETVDGYTFQSSDLSLFPNGAIVELTLNRANYAIITGSDGKPYSVYGFTRIFQECVVTK